MTLLLLVSVSGCGSPRPTPKPVQGTEAPPVITLWHYYQGSARRGLEQAVKNLNDSNPPYHLQLQYIPKADYYQMINQGQAADKGPDLFLVDQSQIPQLFVSGVIQPVDNTFTYSNYFQAAIAAVTFSGNILAVPKSINVPLLAYNKQLVAKAPSSFAELLKDAASNSSAFNSTTVGLSGDLSNLFLSGAWYAGFGGQFYNDSAQPTLDTPQVLNFLQGIVSLAALKAGSYDPVASRSMLLGGSVPFGLISSAELKQYQSSKTLAFSALPQPNMTTGATTASSPTGANYVQVEGFAVSANTKFAAAAAAAAAYLTSPQAVDLYSVPQGEFPAEPAAYTTGALQKSAVAQTIKNIASTGAGYPLDARTNLLLPILSQMIQAVIKGTAPIQAMQAGQIKANKAFGITSP